MDDALAEYAGEAATDSGDASTGENAKPDGPSEAGAMNDAIADGAGESAADSGVPAACADCPSGTKRCELRCESIDNPARGCGAESCAACMPTHAVAKCSMGACAVATCHPGWEDCDRDPSNGCETNLLDPQHCGNCTTQCVPGSKCSSSGCTIACSLPFQDCGPTCANFLNSAVNCNGWGLCARTSFCMAAPTCSSGSCTTTCDLGYTLCNGTCVDLDKPDPELGHACGSCTTACQDDLDPTLNTCSSGSCVCTSGKTDCNGLCRDLTLDPSSCGTCTNVCASGATCVNGTCQTENFVIVDGQNSPSDLALDEANVYWTDSGAGTIMSAPKQGGTAVPLATDQGQAWRIAVHADHVYWTSRTGAWIARVSKSGGAVDYLAPATNPWGIVVDTDFVYWANSSGSMSIERVPKAGGTPEIVAMSVSPNEMTTDGEFIYYYEDTGTSIRSTYIRKLDKRTLNAELLHEEKEARLERRSS